jgi:hypothetical protein
VGTSDKLYNCVSGEVTETWRASSQEVHVVVAVTFRITGASVCPDGVFAVLLISLYLK